MDEIKDNPSDINSLRVLNVLRTIKKRKWQADQLGLPIPKHRCGLDREAALSDGPAPTRRAVSFDRLIARGKAKDGDGSELKSVNDSNSYAEDSDSVSTASISCEAKTEAGFAKTSVRTLSSSSDMVDKDVCTEEGFVDPQALLNLQEQLLEFGNHAEFVANESLDHCTDKELEEILYANGVNSNVYVLSSGRWSVNQEAQSGSRKPTIDQEFEQYFSMLML